MNSTATTDNTYVPGTYTDTPLKIEYARTPSGSARLPRSKKPREARPLLLPEDVITRRTRAQAKSPLTVLNQRNKNSRNSACPCGSGKKFKRCHLPIQKAPPDEHSVPVRTEHVE